MPLVTNAVRISKARKKNDPSRRSVKAGLNKQEKEIFDIYMRALSGMSSDMNNSNVLRAIQEAVAAGNPLDASIAFQWQEFISSLNSVVPNLANQVASSANISAKNLPKRISIESNFTAVDPRAIAWAQQRAGARIQGITQESQKAVAESIVNGLKGGLTRDEVITRLRKIVGLDARQARALGAFYEENLQQLLEEGYTYEEAVAEVTKTSEQYRQRLLTQRATRIARTETLAAANAGRMLSWGEADAQGILPPDSMKRWKTATDERTCPICQPMHNVAVQWQSAFSTGDVMPPAHPNCRCTAVIVPGTFTFEKSKERVIKQTRANSWLFVKHAPGKHDQQSHAGGKGGTGSQVIVFNEARIDELLKKNQDLYSARNKIKDKYPDFGYIRENDPQFKTMSKEDQKKWVELTEEMNKNDSEIRDNYEEYFDNTLEMKSGNSADGTDMGFENESFMAIRDEYVVPDEKTLKTNASLRSTGRVTTKVKRFDSLVEQGKVKAPMRVYRGAVLSPDQVDTLEVGTSFVDRGFQSSGIEMSDATFYVGERARDIAGTKVLFEYDLQTGLNAVNVGYGEVVIQRGAKVTITGSSIKGDYTIIQAEVSKP